MFIRKIKCLGTRRKRTDEEDLIFLWNTEDVDLKKLKKKLPKEWLSTALEEYQKEGRNSTVRDILQAIRLWQEAVYHRMSIERLIVTTDLIGSRKSRSMKWVTSTWPFLARCLHPFLVVVISSPSISFSLYLVIINEPSVYNSTRNGHRAMFLFVPDVLIVELIGHSVGITM